MRIRLILSLVKKLFFAKLASEINFSSFKNIHLVKTL